jgi:hypothetical protein
VTDLPTDTQLRANILVLAQKPPISPGGEHFAQSNPDRSSEERYVKPHIGQQNIMVAKPKVWTGFDFIGLSSARHPRFHRPPPSAFTSFSEFNKSEGGDIWFALDESRPLACFAGI